MLLKMAMSLTSQAFCGRGGGRARRSGGVALRGPPKLFAKRRSGGAGRVAERTKNGSSGGGEDWEKWLALAGGSEPRREGEADGSLDDELNRLSNKCLRAILRERDADLVDVMFEVDEIAEKWRRDEAMSEDACRYASVLYGFLNHEYDERVLDAFESSEYRGSITRLYSLLEDSGWQLVQQGRDQPQEFVDDELLQPPPSFNKY